MYGVPDFYQNDNVKKGTGMQWRHQVVSDLPNWRLVEDRYGQVGYAPAAFLVVILDTTAEEEESDATKKGQENSTEDNQIGGRIGQEGE